MSKKPPLGVIPRDIYWKIEKEGIVYRRKEELLKAIKNYNNESKLIPYEWLEELEMMLFAVSIDEVLNATL